MTLKSDALSMYEYIYVRIKNTYDFNDTVSCPLPSPARQQRTCLRKFYALMTINRLLGRQACRSLPSPRTTHFLALVATESTGQTAASPHNALIFMRRVAIVGRPQMLASRCLNVPTIVHLIYDGVRIVWNMDRDNYPFCVTGQSLSCVPTRWITLSNATWSHWTLSTESPKLDISRFPRGETHYRIPLGGVGRSRGWWMSHRSQQGNTVAGLIHFHSNVEGSNWLSSIWMTVWAKCID